MASKNRSKKSTSKEGISLSKRDLEFTEAMQTKLRLNREKRSKASANRAQSNKPSEGIGLETLRASIAQKVIQRHPGLTRREVERLMERDGF